MKLLTSSVYWASFALTVAIAVTALTSVSRERVLARGIWSHKNDVVIFAQVYPCPPEEVPPPGAAQLFISRDGGLHWEKNGPQLEGSEFEYMHEEEGRLWIIGEHTAEGPAADSFILVPEEKRLEWSQHVIYEGNTEIESIVISKADNFIARIRHLKLGDDGWAGPLYVHQSNDGGRTWRVIGRTERAPERSVKKFKHIEKETSMWRIANEERGDSAIEHRANDHSAWKLIETFPRQTCAP